MRYLALGDSYTIGEGVAEADRWPDQLAAALRGEGIAVSDPTIIATTGWTTDELAAGIDAAAPAPPYDLVSLLIGVNNQYRGRDSANYRDEFSGLLNRAIGLAGRRASHVIVLSIPDWGVTPFGDASGRDVNQITDELDVYNAIAKDVCRAHGVAFVDVTSLSRRYPREVVDDGLHPSATQYRAWMKAAWSAARSALLAA